ncbi:amidohydrolase [Actinomadura sp. 9N215]|uniref:amidohydrolase n=1 Tax=Actinomadura sp. 9N215 TaxID=3375150 RepID=UPI0037AD21BD
MTIAETLLVGGRVLTLDPVRPSATAVAIKDGTIAWVGDAAGAREWRGARTTVIDLDGATLTPGLVDGHTHPVSGVDAAGGLDLSGCRTVDDLRAALAAAVRDVGRGDWVEGHALDHNVFGGRRISRDLIDDVLDGVPAFLRLYDAHSALAGSAALEAAGITGPRAFDQRAAVVCDADGRPTGHLLEHAAMDLVRRLIPPADRSARRRRLLDLLASMAATGLTGGHVMDGQPDALALAAEIEEDGDLPLRLRFAPWCMPGDDLDAVRALQREHGRRWSVGAVKFFVDGTVEGGTAWLEEPDCHGENTDSFWRDPAEYTRAVHKLAADGVQTVTHAIGDAAVKHALDSLETAERTSVRHRIEHIETVGRTQIDRFASLGVVASMQPAHCTYARADQSDGWSRRLGPERARRAWRCRDLREAGAILVLGSDWPVAHFDARETLVAARIRTFPGSGAAPVNPAQALTPRMALEGMTTHAALAAGEPSQTGRITPGSRADLTAFAVNPLRATSSELADAPVRLTLVDGRLTHIADDGPR